MANKIGITVSIKLVNAPDRTERNCKGLRLAITGSLGFKKAEGLRKRKAKRWLPAMGCFFLVKVTSHRFVIAKHYAGIVADFPTQPRGKSKRRIQGRKQPACPQSHRSTADQPLVPLVYQDVSDGGTSRWFQPAPHRNSGTPVPGLFPDPQGWRPTTATPSLFLGAFSSEPSVILIVQ